MTVDRLKELNGMYRKARTEEYKDYLLKTK